MFAKSKLYLYGPRQDNRTTQNSWQPALSILPSYQINIENEFTEKELQYCIYNLRFKVFKLLENRTKKCPKCFDIRFQMATVAAIDMRTGVRDCFAQSKF